MNRSFFPEPFSARRPSLRGVAAMTSRSEKDRISERGEYFWYSIHVWDIFFGIYIYICISRCLVLYTYIAGVRAALRQ